MSKNYNIPNSAILEGFFIFNQDAMLILHNEKITFCNPATIQLFGRETDADIIGQSLELFLSNPEKEQLILQKHISICHQHIHTKFFTYFQVTDNNICQAEVVLSRIDTQEGIYILTKIKPLEFGSLNELQTIQDKVRAQLNGLLNNSADLIYFLNKAGHFVMFNRKFQQVCFDGDFILSNEKTIFQLIPPKDTVYFKEIIEKVFEGQSFETEGFFRLGRVSFYLIINYFPIRDENGNIIMMCVSNRDISQRYKQEQELCAKLEEIKKIKQELQQNEQRLTTFLNRIPVGVLIVEASGVPFFVNQRAQELLGLDERGEGNTGMECFKIAGTENIYPIFKMPIFQALNGNASQKDDIEVIRGTDNERIPIEAIATPVYDEQNKIEYAISIYQDISERKKTQTLGAYNKELIQIQEDLKQKMQQLQNAQNKLTQQKEELELSNRMIMKSLQYAQTIQQAILPSEEDMKQSLKDIFILYRPKDIVSGDFYWYSEHLNYSLIGVIDCTGHGVPGAFMSLMGYNILNEIIFLNDVSKPAQILNSLHVLLRTKLKQDEIKNKDGMDLGFCQIQKIDNENTKVIYAGARHRLYIIKKGELLELKGDRRPVGGANEDNERNYQNQEVFLNSGDMLYLLSDGFSDQANQQRISFSNQQIREMILSIYHLSGEEQQFMFEKALYEHQLDTEQRDDITVIGLRI